MVGAFGGVYAGKRVLVTGHTGFKGSWLCEWLLALGAEVFGYSLPPPTAPSLFEQLRLGERVRQSGGDILEFAPLQKAMADIQPDFLFHLAAQPLVRLSYQEPVLTYQTNVLGTVHVLEALRGLSNPCAAVMVTTDKCYENREWLHGYREEDPMGGFDPYSSSKAMAELGIAAYRRSFFAHSTVRVASARAGNVLGGGDWAQDRIVPDCIRSLQGKSPIPVRNKISRRPWQHVLEPLSGYLRLGAGLATGEPGVDEAFNFGSAVQSNCSVAEVVLEILKHWPGEWEDRSDPKALHEATLLHLSTDKAYGVFGWQPAWDFPQTIAMTVRWYRREHEGADVAELTQQQINDYTQSAVQAGLPWATSTSN